MLPSVFPQGKLGKRGLLRRHISWTWYHLYIKQKLHIYLCTHCHISAGLCHYWLLEMMDSLQAGVRIWIIPQWKDSWMLNKCFNFLMIESHFQLHLFYIYLVAMECLAFCKSSYPCNANGQIWTDMQSHSFIYPQNALV